MFCSEAGTPLDLYNVARVFKRVLKAASLPNFRLYDLRHTFASLLLAKNAPITYVAAQLGHAKPTTTLQWYSHWLPTSRRNYVDALDAEERPSEAVAEVGEAARPAPVPERHGTNRAPFREVSKDHEMEMREKVGSPGRTRTCDILINRPFKRDFVHRSLSQPVAPRRSYLYVNQRGSPARLVAGR